MSLVKLGSETTTSINSESRDGLLARTYPRVGVVSTWNQECGLATYCRYLFSRFDSASVVILAERATTLTRPDQENVRRCWSRKGSAPADSLEYADLEREILANQIEVLHLNVHADFFHYPTFSQLLSRLRSQGIKVVAQLHNTFTVEASLQSLVTSVDVVLVHTPENRLEVIANGALPESVQVIAHGVERYVSTDTPLSVRRESLGLPTNTTLVTSFGFIQPHKGMEAVLEAVHYLKSRGLPSKGIIVGNTRDDDPNSKGYRQQLEKLAHEHGLGQDIIFISRFVSDAEVAEYLAASDVIVMNYRSQHFEASGACSLAVGSGAVVMTSLAPAMMSFGDAVWHLTAGFPPGLAAELLVTNQPLRDEIKKKAREYSEANSWESVAARVLDLHVALIEQQSSGVGTQRELIKVNDFTKSQSENSKMKILIQNRPQTFTLRGGDTVVIEQLQAGLQKLGIEVKVDVEGREDPRNYDLVHIFNFATPEITKFFAEKAKSSGVPYVVTTLSEDLPSFHNQSHVLASRLVDYVDRGQDNIWWDAQRSELSHVPIAPSFDNRWVVDNAAALLCNGAGEASVLQRDYPGVNNIREVKLGHEVGASGNPQLFRDKYGVSDFVLCVGRFESRKNQLMLLKALEHSELTVVLASGGFSYQPDYDRAVRSFQRKGRTVVVDRLEPEMLASAYAACRVHVLASWYELPGLVSLEAASAGKNVVVTRQGTAPDYFGGSAFYCSPSDEESIRNAVLAAYFSPVVQGIQELAKSFTWGRMVEETVRVYEAVSGRASVAAKPSQSISQEVFVSPAVTEKGVVSETTSVSVSVVQQPFVETPEYLDLLERGETAAKNADFENAFELLSKAEHINPRSLRALKAKGAILLAQSKVEESRTYFERALVVDGNDAKVLTGRGMCEMMRQSAATAQPYFKKALQNAPDHLVALHQMVECAYTLNSFEDLHGVLERYLMIKPDDCEMRYCFAGCLYKLGRIKDAVVELDTVLRYRPTHESASELKKKLEQELKTVERVTATQQPPRVEEASSSTSLQVEASSSPLATAAPAAVRPIVSGAGIAESLNDLSKMITEWKVGAQSTTSVTQNPEIAVKGPPPAMTPPPPTQVVEAVQEVLPTTNNLAGFGVQNGASSLPGQLVPQVNVAPPEMRESATTGQREVLPPVSTQGGLDVAFHEIDDLKREKKYEEANRRLDGILARAGITNLQRARAQSAKADILAISGDLVGADLLFDIILRESPEYPRALCGKGALAAEGQKWDEARRYFERARVLDASYDVPLAGLALCEMAANRAEEAFDLFKQAIQINPENHRAILGIIQLGYPLKRYETIQEAITAFLDMHPVNIDMMYSLAGVYFAQNKLSDAKAEVEKILLFDPANARAVELQGMIQAKWAEAPAANSIAMTH